MLKTWIDSKCCRLLSKSFRCFIRSSRSAQDYFTSYIYCLDPLHLSYALNYLYFLELPLITQFSMSFSMVLNRYLSFLVRSIPLRLGSLIVPSGKSSWMLPVLIRISLLYVLRTNLHLPQCQWWVITTVFLLDISSFLHTYFLTYYFLTHSFIREDSVLLIFVYSESNTMPDTY